MDKGRHPATTLAEELKTSAMFHLGQDTARSRTQPLRATLAPQELPAPWFLGPRNQEAMRVDMYVSDHMTLIHLLQNQNEIHLFRQPLLKALADDYQKWKTDLGPDGFSLNRKVVN